MAGTDKKLQSFNAFNAGEYSSDLAGRTDLESFASSSRYSCNFLTQVSGGLKKFYGTRHITEKTTASQDLIMVPFINRYEPMVLVVYENPTEESTGLKVGLVYGDSYKDLNLEFPASIKVRELRWQQINDRLIFSHKTAQPFTVDFFGLDENNEYIFVTNMIAFNEIPYFPIGSTDDYRGELQSSGLSGNVTLSIPSNATDIKVYFPSILMNQSSYNRYKKDDVVGNPSTTSVTVNNSTISIKRIRNGQTTTIASGTVNNYNVDKIAHTSPIGFSTITVSDTITRERILQIAKSVASKAYITGNMINLFGYSGHQDGDEYYMDLSVGSIVVNRAGTSITWFSSGSYTSAHYTPQITTTGTINAEGLVGRKMKFFFNDDTVIDPWWQNKTVSAGAYAYSNGHWYKALTGGNCGNVQPSHTSGDRSDGAVVWRYVHSGSNTATVIGVPSSTSITVHVDSGELPKNTNNIYKNYSWSIWGKDGVHPSEIYMVSGRLGFVCNTKNYGAWNAMSVTDDYFNFSTEEFGEQLDTSAIVGLIGNTEGSDINWVLARTRLYMGGYSGEFYVNPGGTGRRAAVYTPTTTVIENISNMGGKGVIPLKYKELNMFVGGTGKELYTIAYDYTSDDYSPRMMGYLTQHIMERGIKRMVALNNTDRNIYLLHDTKQLSLFNYAAEQKVMGFSELDFGDEVVDFVTTYANDDVAGYVAVRRNDGKITFERLSVRNPNYVFDEITQGDGVTLADFVPVPHFANRTVWIRYGEDLSQFLKAELDANGDVSHDITDGVILPQSKRFKVGLPMVSELHTQPAFGNKVEGHQQQSVSVYLRLNKSGAFDYGCSVDFNKYFRCEYWNSQQAYGDGHRLYTGDMRLNIPLGYAEAQNQGEGKYPNDTAVGINIKSDTPEPLNLLSIQEIYV